MLKNILGTLLLVTCSIAFAQRADNPPSSQVSNALSKVKAQDSQSFKTGAEIDFYCLIASVDHPRAGVMLTCRRRVGEYLMSWGDKYGEYEAFAKTVSKFAPKEIVYARCTVANVWIGKEESDVQIDLACAPPVKAKPQ
jgi:hypothetical protein